MAIKDDNLKLRKRSGTDAVCYTKLLDSLKGWNDHFFRVDTFTCPALFSWHTGKSVSRDGVSTSSEFNAEHYATLVAYPTPFHKYPEPFFCLIGMIHNYSLDGNTYPQFLRNDDEEMDLLSFIRTADPTKVRIGERERDEGEPKLLETTVGRVVSLLPVAPVRSSGELEANVDKLFDEGGNGEQANQDDSAGGGHGAPGVPVVGGKSQSAVHRLLAEAVQHAEVRGEVMPTLPFVSSFVSTTSEREGGAYTEHLAGANLRTLEGLQRFVISSDSSDPPGVNIAEAKVDYVVRTSVPIMTNATTATPTADHAAISKEKLVSASVFGGDSSSAGESHPISGGFSDRTSGDFLVGGIRTIVDLNSNLQRIYVPQWQLFTEFIVGADRQISLGAEVRMRAEYNIKEKRRLKPVVEEKDSLLKSRSDKIESLKAQLLLKEAEAAEAVRHRDETQTLKERNIILEKEKSELEVKVTDLTASVKVREQEVADLNVVVTSVKLQNDSLVDQEFQDAQLKVVNDKLEKLYADFVDMALHLEEKAAIGKAIEKGMQDGLAAKITHGAEGRTLADVVAYNPSTEANYFSALQRLQNINFSLLAELRSSKDASVDTIMNILRLEDNLGKDVSDAWVRKIRENIASQRPALRDVFTPIFEPLSVELLTGTEGTFDIVPAPITIALFVTFIFVLGNPKHFDWFIDVAANQGPRSIAWRTIKIEGPG
nr:hypothetical protein [Tanacetum cinerariifolium]